MGLQYLELQRGFGQEHCQGRQIVPHTLQIDRQKGRITTDIQTCEVKGNRKDFTKATGRQEMIRRQ